MAAATSLCLAQAPGEPVANGLPPTTTTYFVNSPGNTNVSGINTNGPSEPTNNGRVESLGVSIAANGNVVVGWEDDNRDTDPQYNPLLDYEAVWTLFDANGKLITPSTVQTAAQLPGASVTNKWLSYFRADGSALSGALTWGPKIKANLFGNGFGMGSVSFGLSANLPALAAWDDANSGDIPAVQLLNNDGTPITVLPGVTAAFATNNSGNIRIADWDYLSNGNILIVGESRQNQDLVDIFGGAAPQEHVIFRILTPAGAVVKAETLASEFKEKANAWHGAGVTANGFAVRFADATGAATVRMFDNNGNPTTGNLTLATLTGHPEAGGGGRGDSTGFHGNGNDAYVAVCNYASGAWVTVLNTNGTVRFSRNVSDQIMSSLGATDAAITSAGEVVVVYGAKYDAANLGTTILGRRFKANGDAVGNTFFVSEVDRPAPDPINSAANATDPRVAWRGNLVAVIWESQNDPATLQKVVARRLFTSSDITPAGLITAVVEVGGDNEATDTIAAKWTGRIFPVSVANEPLPGLVVGNNYTVGLFGNGAPAFVDRNHAYTNASGTVLIPSYLAGGEYIMSGNDNRDNTNLTMQVFVSKPVQAYLLIDNRLSDGDNATPPTFTSTNMQWVVDQGWTAVRTGNNRTANANVPDEVGIDEGTDGSINQWYSIYTKAFPAGSFQLKQADNSGRNMYGAVITLQPPRVTITQQGANVVITFPTGYRLQRAPAVSGPWTDVSGTSPVTEPASGAQQYYRGISP
jgi:hypothetical protein